MTGHRYERCCHAMSCFLSWFSCGGDTRPDVCYGGSFMPYFVFSLLFRWKDDKAKISDFSSWYNVKTNKTKRRQNTCIKDYKEHPQISTHFRGIFSCRLIYISRQKTNKKQDKTKILQSDNQRHFTLLANYF